MVIVLVLLLLLIWSITSFNKGIRLKGYMTEAFSTMDICMKKRWDLIPNLLETTKGYAQHEKSIFEEVTRLRNQNYATISNVDKMEINNQMAQALAKLVAVAENYPELKANENFIQFSNELSNLESEIASSRKYYNGCVREYNLFLECFPTNIIGYLFHFEKGKLFETSETERENIKVKF